MTSTDYIDPDDDLPPQAYQLPKKRPDRNIDHLPTWAILAHLYKRHEALILYLLLASSWTFMLIHH